MTFPIFTGVSGYAGLQALDRIENRYKKIISRDPVVIKDISHFRKRMKAVKTADDLVKDYRLYTTALNAFGIEDQAGNRAFIKKILSADLDDSNSIANRIPDKRILRMAKAFDFYKREKSYSREERDFLKITALEGSDKAIKEKVLSARKKFLDLVEPYKNNIEQIKHRSEMQVLQELEDGSDSEGEKKPAEELKLPGWQGRGREWAKILEDKELTDIIKTALGFDSNFNLYSRTKKIEKINKALMSKIGVEPKPVTDIKGNVIDLGPSAVFYEFGKPKNMERFFRTYAYNIGNVSHKEQPSFDSELVDQISKDYIDREFERRVGLGDDTMRLALNARRELGSLAERTSSKKTLWLEVIGNPPLRKVFETAFGFGPEYAKLEVDRQASEFSKAAKRLLGTDSFDQIGSSKKTERLLRTYMARASISVGGVSGSSLNRYNTALSLLSGATGNSGPSLLLGG